MPFTLEHKLCLNDMVVPLIRRTFDLEDLHNLADGDADHQEFLVLDLKATGDMHWFEKCFKLRNRFWKNQGHLRTPLMQEMRDAIQEGKPGRYSRKPRLPNAVVAVELRGQVALVLNQVSSLGLALRPGQESANLQWFLEELEKDLENLSAEKEPHGPHRPAPSPSHSLEDGDDNVDNNNEEEIGKSHDPAREKALVDECLSLLRGHADCQRACWQPSRSCFKVTRKDKATSRFGAPASKKKRKSAYEKGDWELVRDSLGASVSQALEFLCGAQHAVHPAPSEADTALGDLADEDPRQAEEAIEALVDEGQD